MLLAVMLLVVNFGSLFILCLLDGQSDDFCLFVGHHFIHVHFMIVRSILSDQTLVNAILISVLSS